MSLGAEGELETLVTLSDVCAERDRYKAALEIIVEMPNTSIWTDDRDDAADSMWKAARDALFPPKRKKQKCG